MKPILKTKNMKSITKKVFLIGMVSILLIPNSNAQDGEKIFKANCTSCHRTDTKRLVGPGLEGIKNKRSKEWLAKWIKDSPSLVASGDADAKAIFEEYNNMPMPSFSFLSDADIAAIIEFFPSAAVVTEVKKEVVEEPAAPIEYTEEDVHNGKLLFGGGKRFTNGGPTCITCHNVTNNEVMAGGLLAKDLTNVYGRMGDAGIGGILSAPPFPAMNNAYGKKPLSEEEIIQLTAFFKQADKVSKTQDANSGFGMMLGGGFTGLIVVLLLVSLIWKQRKKESVKKDIFARQTRSNDAKVY